MLRHSKYFLNRQSNAKIRTCFVDFERTALPELSGTVLAMLTYLFLLLGH